MKILFFLLVSMVFGMEEDSNLWIEEGRIGITPGAPPRTDIYSYESLADFGDTALHFAAANGDDVLVRQLLERGFPMNEVNNQGYTPLDCASIMGHTQSEKLLKSHGAYGASVEKIIVPSQSSWLKWGLIISGGLLGLAYWYFYVKENQKLEKETVSENVPEQPHPPTEDLA